MLPTKFRSFGHAVSEEKICRYRPIRNKNCLWRPCLETNRAEMNNFHKRLSIDVSYQVSTHLPKRCHRRIFLRNRLIRNKNCLWQPCLSKDRDNMHNLNRGPYMDASYQVAVHLAVQFQRSRLFRNQPIRSKKCPWRPYLLTDRDEMNNLYSGPIIDDCYQVLVHLTNRFQRRIFFWNRSI
jgi:hypothetical protein